LRDVARTFEFDDAYGKTAQASNIFRSISGAYSASIFVEVPIDHVMAALNAPVAAVGGKNALSVGLFGRPAGDTVDYITGIFTAFFIRTLSLDRKRLSYPRKVKIAVKLGCDPNLSDFDSAVVRRIGNDKIGFPPISKIKGDICKNSRLVIFDSEMIMSIAFVHNIGGDLTLG
jgi:hypothetical protein